MGADDGDVHLSDVVGPLDPYVVTWREDPFGYTQVLELVIGVVLVCQY